jgi:tubulin---tyrosine ligase
MEAFVRCANRWLDPYVKACILRLEPSAVIHDSLVSFPEEPDLVFQLCDGSGLGPHFSMLNKAQNGLLSAYPNSDALSRKSFLAESIERWISKRPMSVLKRHAPVTIRLSLDYGEFVDDALTQADLTLMHSLIDNQVKIPSDRHWWVLKAALVDGGGGIRLFSTIDELASCLELAEGSQEGESRCEDTFQGPESSTVSKLAPAQGVLHKEDNPQHETSEIGRLASSQIREFVAQSCITAVALLEGRKWHARAYVLSLGRLKVYVFREMLALLALDQYRTPWEKPGPRAFLTNTSLQPEAEITLMGSRRDFWTLPDNLLPGDWKESVFSQVCNISAELFLAASNTMSDRFIPIDKCFGVFALDFLVDRTGNAWILEVNETPAFSESGVSGPLAQRLMESVLYLAFEHMAEKESASSMNEAVKERMVKVLDISDEIGKCNITSVVPEN